MKQVKKDAVTDSTVVRMQQVYEGVPVWGSTQVAHVSKDGSLKVLSGTVAPDLDKKEKLKNKIRLKAQKQLKSRSKI